MTENSPEIYVPIESTKLHEVIPPGDKILISTLCSGQYYGSYTVQGTYGTQQIIRFTSHVIFTTGGVAYTMPKNNQVQFIYDPWHEVTDLSGIDPMKGFEIQGYIRFFVPKG